MMYCNACESVRTPTDNGDCPVCGELLQPVNVDATPNEELRALVEQWRDRGTPIKDAGDESYRIAAEELEAVIDDE